MAELYASPNRGIGPAPRPRRLQALQRLVRSPGRRRLARPARRQARSIRGLRRAELPPRWRRVLRSCTGAGRRRGTALDATVAALSEGGEGFSVGTSFGAVFLPDQAREPAEALGIADQRLYAQKHGKGSNRGQTHDVLLQAMYERRPVLQQRVLAGADLSLSVAERLGLRGEELEKVRRAAELRDVGTIAIPDEILLKAGPLDDEEWAFISRHTEVGQRILSAAPALLEIAKIVRSTHERWNGLGYPDGLAGEAIPLGSRIISVCDAFVAMTSDRPIPGP